MDNSYRNPLIERERYVGLAAEFVTCIYQLTNSTVNVMIAHQTRHLLSFSREIEGNKMK